MEETKPDVVTVRGKKDGGILRARLAPTEKVQTRATTPMAAGIKYSVFFFDATTKKCIATKDIVAGQEADSKIRLAAGTYIVRAVSYNSASLLPAISGTVASNPLEGLIGDFDFVVGPTVGDLLYANPTEQLTISSTDTEKTYSLTFSHLFNSLQLQPGAYTIYGNGTQVFYMDKGTTAFATDATTINDSGTISDVSGNITSYTQATLNFNTTSPLSVSSSYLGTVPISSGTTLACLPENDDITLTISDATPTQLVGKTVTFTGGATEGKSYTLAFSWVGNTSGTLVPLYWAMGNLKYTGYTTGQANGAYAFFEHQSDYEVMADAKLHSFFQWNALYPDKSQISGSAYNVYAYDKDLDPCSKVTLLHASWRTPTQTELQIINDTFNDNGHSGFANGYWIGAGLNGSSPASDKESQYLFLPAAGYSYFINYVGSGGDYWSATRDNSGSSSTQQGYSLGFSDGSMSLNPVDRSMARTVRCVSDTK
jgi:hypothetical protein